MGEPRLVGGGHINRMVGDPPSSYVFDAPYLELRVLTDDQSYLGELLDPSNKSMFWVEIQEKYKNLFLSLFLYFYNPNFTIFTFQGWRLILSELGKNSEAIEEKHPHCLGSRKRMKEMLSKAK